MIEARATVGGWDDSERSAWGIKLTRCVFLRKVQEFSTVYTSGIEIIYYPGNYSYGE